MPLLSIATPVYKTESLVGTLVERIRAAASTVTEDFEVLLVEDGSPDDSWAAIVRECDRDPRIRGVRLSRNFGQHPAITAALEHVRGDFVVIMDCDLQDDPDYIPSLYDKCREGFDVVFARRRIRRFGWWKNISARIYYTIFRWLAGVAYDPNIGSYSIISRRVVDAFLQFGDYRRGYVIVLHWLGFSRGYVDVEHRERPDGRSSYTAWQLMVHALTLTLTYSEKPLHLSIYIGSVLSLLSFVFGGWFIVRYFNSNVGQLALGWTSLMISHLFLSGLILISLGVIGLYMGRIFEQVKHRPIYVVRETKNMPASSPRSSAWL
jgi:glycosyltransferase involved in cell wall biosynthesis